MKTTILSIWTRRRGESSSALMHSLQKRSDYTMKDYKLSENEQRHSSGPRRNNVSSDAEWKLSGRRRRGGLSKNALNVNEQRHSGLSKRDARERGLRHNGPRRRKGRKNGIEALRAEEEKREKARIDAQRAEEARREKERIEVQRAEEEKREKARLEAERVEQARREDELERGRTEAMLSLDSRAENERLAAERAEEKRLRREKRKTSKANVDFSALVSSRNQEDSEGESDSELYGAPEASEFSHPIRQMPELIKLPDILPTPAPLKQQVEQQVAQPAVTDTPLDTPIEYVADQQPSARRSHRSFRTSIEHTELLRKSLQAQGLLKDDDVPASVPRGSGGNAEPPTPKKEERSVSALKMFGLNFFDSDSEDAEEQEPKRRPQNVSRVDPGFVPDLQDDAVDDGDLKKRWKGDDSDEERGSQDFIAAVLLNCGCATSRKGKGKHLA
eukprot:c18834_g1_i4.p1 GENE.c18834_g1_i4~~c18834_g1_i4.p1  ORF type:complete len:445 (+),score=75.04 c18834_g1_i4:452-1786(+)